MTVLPTTSTNKESQEEKSIEKTIDTAIEKLTNINFEPLIEDYILDNYFKIYKLLLFQLQGIINIINLLYLNIILDWISKHSNLICHRPHCKYVYKKIM